MPAPWSELARAGGRERLIVNPLNRFYLTLAFAGALACGGADPVAPKPSDSKDDNTDDGSNDSDDDDVVFDGGSESDDSDDVVPSPDAGRATDSGAKDASSSVGDQSKDASAAKDAGIEVKDAGSTVGSTKDAGSSSSNNSSTNSDAGADAGSDPFADLTNLLGSDPLGLGAPGSAPTTGSMPTNPLEGLDPSTIGTALGIDPSMIPQLDPNALPAIDPSALGDLSTIFGGAANPTAPTTGSDDDADSTDDADSDDDSSANADDDSNSDSEDDDQATDDKP